MGLDAFVFCDCYAKGRQKRPPPDPEVVYVLPHGDLDCRSGDPKVQARFDRWRSTACAHREGVLAGDRFGNISGIARLREILAPHRRLFPTLLNHVIWSGSHTGDHLTFQQVRKLSGELDHLKSFRCGDKVFSREIQAFRRRLARLVRIALKVERPVAF